MKHVTSRFAVAGFWRNVVLSYDLKRIFIHVDCEVKNNEVVQVGSGFSKPLNNEIKLMSNRQYHGYDGAPLRDYCLKNFGRDKIWSVDDNHHNRFHIEFLQGKNPYQRYKENLNFDELPEIPEPLMKHQIETVAFMLQRRQCIIAEKMGLGKTLSEMVSRRIVKPKSTLYAGPNAAIKAVQRDHRKWKMPLYDQMMTYQGLVALIKSHEGSTHFVPPQWVVFDEAQDLKSPTSQRSQAAYILTEAMREYYGDDCYILLMTGTPAPQCPLDWWMLQEIARPGYLIEGSIHALRERLAILEDRDFGSGTFKHVAAWKDRDDFCDVCGKTQSDSVHDPDTSYLSEGEHHIFKPGKNEVSYLYKRLSGLVIIKTKEECLDLPEKRFEEIELEISHKMKQLAQSIARTARTSAEALTQLCTLSDGFMYVDELVGTKVCDICNGAKEALESVLKDPDAEITTENTADLFEQRMVACCGCDGTGKKNVYARKTNEVETPKDDALLELIERHEEVGRFVTYAAFQGSIDRIEKLYRSREWETIVWDGRGCRCSVPDVDALDLFQDMLGKHPKVGFIAHPRAAGVGLTLTASPGICFYSNTFNAVDRLQAADRIHRIGMDVNRGATIYDLFHLPTDRLVYNNLQEKIARQDLTMGLDIDMQAVLETLR